MTDKAGVEPGRRVELIVEIGLEELPTSWLREMMTVPKGVPGGSSIRVPVAPGVRALAGV